MNEVESITDWEKNIKLKSTYEYEYDNKGNWISKITFKDGVATEVSDREYEYYD